MNKQELILNECIKNGFFKCPSCKESWTPEPLIENEGEEETLVYCFYDCGYVLLENYIKLEEDD